MGLLSLAAAQLNGSVATALSTFTPPQHFRNLNLVRNINLDKNYVRETVNVVIQNIDSQPQSEYYLAFDSGAASRVGAVEVKDKKEPTKGGFLASIAEDDSMM